MVHPDPPLTVMRSVNPPVQLELLSVDEENEELGDRLMLLDVPYEDEMLTEEPDDDPELLRDAEAGVDDDVP